MSLKENRPWGTFEVLHTDNQCKIKRIIVNPGQQLSLQYHTKREEHWYVIEGAGLVTCGDASWGLTTGMSTNIPRMTPHQISNFGDTKLVFIEIQTGDYFGEDDIVRIKDIYNRI